MARLEATLDANINPFARKLEEAQEKAGEFSEKLGDVGKDLLKGLAGIDIGEALKLGVGIYAAKQLGEALVDAAKEGYAEFQKFQDAVLSFKYTLPSAAGDLAEREKVAKEEAEAAEKRTGAFDFETQYKTAQALIQASRVFGESMEKTDEMAKHLTALAIITHSTPEAEAENLRRALVSRREDSGEALGRFFKRTPGLEEQARLMREREAAAHPEEAAEIRRMGIPQFMAAETRGKTDEEIIRLLSEMVEKAAPESVIKERAATHPEEALKEPLGAMQKAFGEKLLPVVAELTDGLLAALPAIKEFGLDILDLILPAFGDVITIVKEVGSELSFLAGILSPVREAMEGLGRTIREGVAERIGELSAKIGAWLGKMAESTGLLDAFASALKAAATVGGLIGEEFKKAYNAVADYIENIVRVTHIMDLLRTAFEEIKLQVIGAFLFIAAAVKDAAEIITNAAKTVAGWLHITLPSAAPEKEKATPAEEKGGEEGGGETKAAEASMKEALEADTGIFSEAYVKGANEAAAVQIKSNAAHEESARRINLAAEQTDIRAAAAAEARHALIDRPRGQTEALDKQYAAQAEADAKSINIRAEAAAKIRAIDEEEESAKAKIDEEIALRNLKRAEEDRHQFSLSQDEIDARAAVRRAEDAASDLARNDLTDAAAEKRRAADMDAANKIIDAQEAAAERIINEQEAAAIAQIEKMKGPFEKEEAPGKWETFSKFGKHGEVIEGSADRKAREERNESAEEANRQWKEMQLMGVRKEFADKKRLVEDSLEAQRPTQIGLKRTHEIQQEEHVKAIAAGKLRTEADVDFAAQHKALGLPPSPDKAKAGAGDVSRKLLAEILAKILEAEISQTKDFEKVFMSE